MSLNSVRFSCTALNAKNKAGVLKPDGEGYYDTVIGGLNIYNSAGEFYTAEDARDLFEGSSLFMKRVARGRLRGECGHPKKMPGERDRDYLNRIFLIDEGRVSHHFKEIYLDEKNVKDANGRAVIAIMGKITPSGPMGPALQKSLDNPAENVCFSIRAFTDDKFVSGVNERKLKTVITFDWVNDCGIPVAEKFYAPALESLYEKVVTRNQLEEVLHQPKMGIAQESAIMNAQELYASLGWDISPKDKPAFMKW